MSKTIETHLQSNEVRIPKKSNEFDVTGSSAAPCQYFKSSFARSLSFSQGPGGGPASGGGRGGGPYGGAEQHFTRSLDFDVNFDPIGSGGRGGGGGGGMVESDGGGTAAATMMMMMMMGTTPSSASPVYEEEGEGTVSRGESDPEPGCGMMNGGGGGGGIEASNGGIVKTLWNYAKGQDIKSANSSPAKRAAITVKSNGGGGVMGGPRKSIEANEIEVLRLRKECQNLIEENRRLVSIASGAGNGYAISGMLNGGGSGSLSTLGMGVPNGGSYTSVESVILQTQVETLQWQLKQVDSSRHMYRAVMEEVVRFLDRCYRSLDALQSGQIGRSKSVLQVSKTGGAQNHHQPHHQHHQHDSDSSSASSPRARSSTNLVEVQPKSYTKATGGHNGRLEHQQHQPSSLTSINNSSSTASQHAAASAHHEDECVVPPSPASSYSNFRDFTWRRSPKRTQTLPISSNEVDPEKLAQEAFRLLRTVQNLLNTQEPTLAQSTNALDSLISASTAASSCGSSTTLTGVGLSASGAMLGSTPTLTGIGVGGGGAGGGAGGDGDRARMTVGGMSNGVGVGGGVGSHPLVNTRSTVGFNRKLNMRGSRLSVRSSTADSVHSTSSSTKTETDEDNTDRPSPPLLLAHHHHHHHLLHHQSSGGGVNGGGVGSGGGGGGGGSSSSSCSSSTTSGNGSLNGNGHHHHHHHHHHHNPAHRYSANIERIKEMMISSSAEDESGFSSMNSFQEIGLPLVNSTMLSSVGSSHGVSNGSLGGGSSASSNESGTNSSSNSGGGGAGGGTFGVSEDSSELRENTVIPTTGASSNNSANKLGIPSSPSVKAATSVSASSNSSSNATAITATSTAATASSGSPLRATQAASYEHHTHFINHRRWDSAPVVPPKLKIHAGETDTVSRVLWV